MTRIALPASPSALHASSSDTRAIEAAALAQKQQHTIVRTFSSVMGIDITRLAVTAPPFRVSYGAASTALSLEAAARAFYGMLTDVIALADEDAALSRLRGAMRKTGKLLNALGKIVVPRIAHEIRRVVEGIDEEERDEALRRTVWRRAAASPQPVGPCQHQRGEGLLP